MISDKSSLASRLGWISSELDSLLATAKQTFSQYTEANDAKALEACQETIRQVWGVLDILGAEGASMLGRELVLLLEALVQNKVDNIKAAREAIAEGILQLSEYLKHLNEGYADLPVIVLPTLNNLRAARDAELLSEHLVFLPEDDSLGLEQMGTDEYVKLDAEKLYQVVTKLRFYFQKALLGWFKGDEPQKMLQAAAKVSTNMQVLNKTPRLRKLWWINAALAEALGENRLEHGIAVKMLMGRMEREIRRFSELGETVYNETVPDELIKNLLYYIGLSASGTDLTDKVKRVYNLDMYLPQGETLSELRQHYTTPGRDLWRAVSGSVIDELKALQVIVESIKPDESDCAEALSKLLDKSSRLASTLGMMGLSQASNLTLGLCDTLKEYLDSHSGPSRESLMNISAHYINLEKVLKEYAETGYDITEDVFSPDGLILDPSASRSLLRTVLTELSKVQARLVSFYKEGWSFFYLDEAVLALDNIIGALEMSGAKEMLPLVETAKRYLAKDLIAQKRTPSKEELAIFADILTLFEASVSTKLQGEDYLSLLPIGFDKLRELDQLCPINLLGGVDLNAVEQDVEAKKKAAQANSSSNLLHRLRSARPSMAVLQPA